MKGLLRSKQFLSLAAFVLIASVIAVPFAGNIKHSHAQGTTQETLTVPFVNGQNGVTTTNSYSGSVTITVSGYGQQAGTQDSDAFYIFTDSAGNPVTPYHLSSFGLWINHQPVENYLTAIPPYSSNHTYRFTISLSGTPQPINFGIGDTYTVDNSGSFTITITSQTQAPSRQQQAEQLCRQFLPESACMVIIGEVQASPAQLQSIKELLQGLGQAAHDALCTNPGREVLFGPNKDLANFLCGPRK